MPARDQVQKGSADLGRKSQSLCCWNTDRTSCHGKPVVEAGSLWIPERTRAFQRHDASTTCCSTQRQISTRDACVRIRGISVIQDRRRNGTSHAGPASRGHIWHRRYSWAGTSLESFPEAGSTMWHKSDRWEVAAYAGGPREMSPGKGPAARLAENATAGVVEEVQTDCSMMAVAGEERFVSNPYESNRLEHLCRRSTYRPPSHARSWTWEGIWDQTWRPRAFRQEEMAWKSKMMMMG